MPNRTPRHKPKRYDEAPEAAIAREHAAFTPWMVTLYVYESMLEPNPVRISMFVRAPKPVLAMHSARMIWARYTKELPAKRDRREVPEWPKLDDKHDVLCLDDADYAAFWHDAQRYPHYFAGNKENPIGFAFFPEKRLVG